MIDYSEIQEKFNKVLAHSQNLDKVNTDDLFDQWAIAKSDFINRFGGLTVEIPNISFGLSDEKREELFTFFVNNCENEDAAIFLRTMGCKNFYENIVKREYVINEEKAIPKGMKISRALRFFYDDPTEIQIAMSRILQEDKITGTLCFSVHPLDFLSLSENNSNWRSCHSLDGDYRAGNLSYMVDKCTMIAYLRHDSEPVILERFGPEVPWNDKKWRCLIFFSEDRNICFAGRQYPFPSAGALDTIRDRLLEDYFSGSRWKNWDNGRMTNFVTGDGFNCRIEPHILLLGDLRSLPSIVQDARGSRHYNDLLYSTVYTPYYTSRSHATFSPSESIVRLGGPVRCVRCGDRESGSEEPMMCDECADYRYMSNEHMFCCEVCGRFHPAYESQLVNDTYQVCESCWDAYCGSCDICNEVFFIEDLTFDEDTNEYKCKYCLEEE